MKQEKSSSIFPEFSWQRRMTFQKRSICAAEVIASPGWGGLCGGPRQRGGRNLADLKHSKLCSSFEPGSQGPRVMKRRSRAYNVGKLAFREVLGMRWLWEFDH